MRIGFTLAFAALSLAAAVAPTSAQVYVTGVTASIPDPNGKVPTLNTYPGAGIPTFSDGWAQGVLVNGHYYDYCVSIASATAGGTASLEFKIARGKTTIQSATIYKIKEIASDQIYYYCSGDTELPDSPGAAVLSGIVKYTPTGSSKTVTSQLNVSVMLQ